MSIRGPIVWSYSTGTDGATFVGGIDPTNTYYLVSAGGPPVAFPVTVGHYPSHPAPGIAARGATGNCCNAASAWTGPPARGSCFTSKSSRVLR